MKQAQKTAAGSGWCILILAAGEGTRMESDLPKVLHPVGGRPLAFYILRLANALKPNGIGVVVGHQRELVQREMQEMAKGLGIRRPVAFIRQKDTTGSGGAMIESAPFLKKFQTALVLCGDTPLVTFESLFAMLNAHREQKGQVTLLTGKLANPKGYGRVVRGPLGDVLRIVEESEASPKEAAITEVNSGAYCFEVPTLLEALKSVRPAGPKREQYLTHCLESMRTKGGRITAFVSANPEEILGINSRAQLAQAERVLNRRAVERLMLAGVTVADPSHTYVDADADVARDTVLLPGTILKGRTKIGKECRIGPHAYLEDSEVGNGCEVRMSYLSGAKVLDKCSIGPYSHLRPGAVVGPKAKVGNFSELKEARVGAGSKVSHLSYIGDCEIGDNVNVGAGTITCNFDGQKKHKTVIEAEAFIGSNVNLVAPVTIGRKAMVGAGSTITENVPGGALAIARARQVNKERK